MKCSLDIFNYLEEIFSLSHSIVFFYFFALITEKGFLISPRYSLELCIQWVYLSFSPLLFFFFTAICKASSDNDFAFFVFLFLGDGSFKYDLNQIPYDYTVEVTNRFKGLDLIDRVLEELQTEVRDTVQETGIKAIPKEKKCKEAKWLSEEALQIAVKRREVK